MTTYEYRGPGNRSYPGYQNPETGAVLWGLHPAQMADDPDSEPLPWWEQPGGPIDFGDQLPPADGFWYDAATDQPYTGPPIAPEPAGVGDASFTEPPGTGADAGKEE